MANIIPLESNHHFQDFDHFKYQCLVLFPPFALDDADLQTAAVLDQLEGYRPLSILVHSLKFNTVLFDLFDHFFSLE